jgi:energy-coupling factor transporter ATP-binding protein EcfA2
LDDILDFSEMGRFIDVPVKHYSSGMYMRLGFSIAINLRPDILLVDEVLAVGDQAFQMRCLDKIHELRRQGISIVLVTHDLNSVREMCDRAIWLDEGEIQVEGPVEHVLDEYLTDVLIEEGQDLLAADAERVEPSTDKDDSSWRWGSREGEIVRVQLLNAQGQEQRIFQTGETVIVRLHFVARQRIEKPQFGIGLHHASGFHINGPNTVLAGLEIDAIEGEGYIDHIMGSIPFLEGTYLLSVSLYDHEGLHAYDYHHQVYTFRVRPNKAIREEYGSIYIPSAWQMGPTGFHVSRTVKDGS